MKQDGDWQAIKPFLQSIPEVRMVFNFFPSQMARAANEKNVSNG